MQTSKVKWFDADKGYGFINHPEDGEDVFVHYSNIQSEDEFKTLQSDQRVRFDMNDGPKGLHALEVEAIDEGESTASQTQDSSSSNIAPADLDPTAEVDPFASEGESSSESSW